MSEWWAIAGLLLTGLFSGGGVVGILNWRRARSEGERDDARDDDNAAVTQMKTIIDAQFESLVKPLQDEVTRLRAEVSSVKEAVEQLKGRYWKAVGYSRTLLSWIDRTFPGHPHNVPRAMEDIRSDVEIE